MTKKDLRTGDIIVTRNGELGVVLEEEEIILYQFDGSDMLDEFKDDLTYEDEDYTDCDIMEVYRGNTFFDVDNDDDVPIYQRDPDWVRPSKEEMEARRKALEEEHKREFEEMQKDIEKRKANCISVIAQYFYGNITSTEVNRENIDFFLKGILSPELFVGADKTVDRKIVRIPDSDNVVIVYDQNQEDKYINVKFPENYAKFGKEYKEKYGTEMTMQVSCDIPEIGFKIHTRCFACRIDENGELQSILPEDYEKIMRYLTK